MKRKLRTARLSLTEGDPGECLISCGERGKPDHPRLVAENVAAVAGSRHTAPGRLGEVGRGEHEESEPLVVLADLGVGLDVRRSSGSAASFG